MNKHQTIMSELARELSEEITENGWYKFQMYIHKGDSGITHLDGTSLVKANAPEDERICSVCGQSFDESVTMLCPYCHRVD